MQRIVIVGSTGGGKSTLALQLAERRGLPLIELDDLYHLPGWRQRPDDEFRRLVDTATQADKWIVTGNYNSKTQDIVWPRADTLVWIDLPFLLNFWQLLCRSLSRAWTGQSVCNGNRETFSRQFFSKESILWWLIKTWRRNGVRYGAVFAHPEKHPHLKLIHLKSRADLKRFVSE